MNDQALIKLKEAFEQTEEISVQGKTIFQTPSIVESTLKPAFINRVIGFSLIQGFARWKPSIKTPRIEFIIGASENVELLGANISYSNLDFPYSCCKCMGSASHFELVELVSKEIGGKTRTWFAIPFCEEHNLESKAISIDIKGQNSEKVVMQFTNRKYGLLFGERNAITGYRITSKTMRTRAYTPVGIFSGAAMIFFGSIFLFDNLVGFEARIEKGLGSLTPLPISLSVFIVGIVLTIWFTSFRIKNRKGEKL